MAYSYLGKESTATDAHTAYIRRTKPITPLDAVARSVTRYSQDKLKYDLHRMPSTNELRVVLEGLAPNDLDIFIPAWAYLFNGALVPQIAGSFTQDFSTSQVVQTFNRAIIGARNPRDRERKFPLLRADVLLPTDTRQLDQEATHAIRKSLIENNGWRHYFETEATLMSLKPVELLLTEHVPAHRLEPDFMPAILETGRELADATTIVIARLGLSAKPIKKPY